VLNALITAHPKARLGVSSIGLDGEELDTVSRLPKPRVFLPAGSLLATAEDCLAQSEARDRVAARTGIRTGLGEILVASVTRPGNCLLGGPSTVEGMAAVRDSLLRLGADKVFIDGAFSRQSHAAAAQAMVYVVGAHASPVQSRVVASAGLALRRFALPGVPDAWQPLPAQANPGWLDHQGRYTALAPATALGKPEALLDAVPAGACWLYLPGAVDTALADALVARRSEQAFGLIVQSALSLVMSDAALGRLFRLGRDIRVLRPLTLAFVALNPYSPAGHRFDSAAFRQAMRAVTDLPLINVAEDVN
jgi:hypothetical protein